MQNANKAATKNCFTHITFHSAIVLCFQLFEFLSMSFMGKWINISDMGKIPSRNFVKTEVSLCPFYLVC